MIIEYKNQNDNTILRKCKIPLKDLKSGKTYEMEKELQPSGYKSLFLQPNKKDIKPFQDINLSPYVNTYTTFYIKIINAREVPIADNTGLSDSFCILELKDRKEKNCYKNSNINSRMESIFSISNNII